MWLRPARLPDDAGALAALYLAAASHHARLDPARYAVPARAEVVGHYEALRLDGDHVLFVAEIDGVVVGFVELEWLRPPPVWSMLRNGRRAHLDIAVAEEFRARGIGSRLLETAESWARRSGGARPRRTHRQRASARVLRDGRLRSLRHAHGEAARLRVTSTLERPGLGRQGVQGQRPV